MAVPRDEILASFSCVKGGINSNFNLIKKNPKMYLIQEMLESNFCKCVLRSRVGFQVESLK